MRSAISVIGHYGMSLLMDVKHFPAIGETVEGSKLEFEPGGKGYNQAVAASRLGAEVHFITAVGEDTFGNRCEFDLDTEHIKGKYIVKIPNQKTACAFVVNTKNGENEVYVYPGAIRHMQPKHIREYASVIEDSQLVLLQNEVSEETLREAAQIAGKAGVDIIYNPAPARNVPSEILKYITILTPNETEAAILTGQALDKPLDIDEAFIKLHNLGVKNIIITMGEKGSILSIQGNRYHVKPFCGKTVSTAGAGDCYNAALAVKYMETHDICLAAQYASIAAGMKVMRHGVNQNFPYKQEVDTLFRTHSGKMIMALQCRCYNDV